MRNQHGCSWFIAAQPFQSGGARVGRGVLSETQWLWRCLCSILEILVDQEEEVWSAASMPLVLGGVGLRYALRVRTPAYWSSWVDCLPVHNSHPPIADRLVAELEEPSTPFLSGAAEAARTLTGTMGFDPSQLARGSAWSSTTSSRPRRFRSWPRLAA